MKAVVFDEYFIDIGIPQDYLEQEIELPLLLDSKLER